MSTYDAQKNMREAFKKLMDEQEGLEQRFALVAEELDEERTKARELQRRLDTLPRSSFPQGIVLGFLIGVALACLIALWFRP